MTEINNLYKEIRINKYKNKKQICILFFLSIILLVSFFRVPIIGVLIDSLTFEFLFGYTKYLFYILIALALCLWFKKRYFYFLFNKRKVLFYSLLIYVLSFLLSTINLYLNQLDKLSFTEFYVNNQYSYISNWYIFNLKDISDIKSYLMFNIYQWGGLIGTIFISILNKYSFIVFLFFLLIILIIFSLIVFNKKISVNLKKKIISKLGGYSSNQIKIIKQKTIYHSKILNDSKKLILNNTNLKKDQIEIQESEIQIKIINLKEIEYILNIIKKLKIENVKIIIKTNELNI